jgi:two-component system, cell cycle sensor histidine kinase and response regulator CckA
LKKDIFETILQRWNKVEKRMLPSYVWQSDPLTFWQERILFLLFFLGTVIGPPVLIPSVLLAYAEGLWSIIILDIAAFLIMIAGLLGRRWPMRVRGFLASLCLYGLGVCLSFLLGPFGAGYIWLFGASVMVSVLLGMKAAIISMVLNALTLSFIAFLIHTGSVEWAAAIDHPLQKWLVSSLNFMLLNAFTTLTTAFIIGGLKKALANELRASADLRVHHERFLTVLDSIDAAVLVVDLETYEILFMNKRRIESSGKDLTGTSCWESIRGQSRPCETCNKNTLLDAAGEPTGVHVRHEQHPVTQRWYVIYDRAIKWTDGRMVKIQISTDITELKRMESELRQAHKMEAIGTLAGGIAHDFNNILSSILGYTELALDDAPRGTLLEDNLLEVLTAAKRARDLVKQILAFARQSEEKVKPIQIRPIAREALKLIRSTLPADIEIRSNLISDSAMMGNPTQIHQILINLCTNAAHAMEFTGGVLEVDLEDVRVTAHTAPAHGNLETGDYLRLRVSDTGVGIAPEHIESVFQPFFTTKAPGQGTGMGLAMVHGIMESYKGKIMVDSQPGEGTRFTLYFPVSKTQAEEHLDGSPELPTGRERILLVDDEYPIVNMAGMILERLGYNVTSRTSSIEALNLFRSRPMDFDLILTDMTMPNMTGAELASEIMRIRPDIPVVLCTGYSNKISETLSTQLGIRAFAYKPFIKKDMAVTLRRVLNENRTVTVQPVECDSNEYP